MKPQFINVYNDLVKGYQVLSANYDELSEDNKKLFHLALSRLNCAAGSEHMIDANGTQMYEYSFQAGIFGSNNALICLKRSAYYIVLARVLWQAENITSNGSTH